MDLRGGGVLMDARLMFGLWTPHGIQGLRGCQY